MVTIRAATADDLPACREVWLATESYPAPASRDVLPLHAHELRHGRLLVADAGARAGVVGFGATITRSGVAYLADLFVAPDRHGQGIGGRLLDALFAGHHGPRFTMASSSGAAQRLYARHGMAPSWSLSYLLGELPSIDTSAMADPSVTVRRTTVAAVLALDATITRRDRQPELEHETTNLGGHVLAVERGGELIGHAVVIRGTWWVPWRPQGTRLAPVVVRDERDAIAAFAAAVEYARTLGATVVNSFVPGPHPAHDPLIAAGFRRVDADLHMTSDPTLLDPARYAPSIDTV